MIPKKYPYKAIDGDHWPDSDLGDDLFYGIDLNPWLNNEEDTLSSVSWDIPKGLSSTEDIVTNNTANIKISSDTIGSFTIKCTIETIESLHTQINVIPMILKVY